jgi:hypothetical protein
MLREAATHGRIGIMELDERSASAYAAVTRSERGVGGAHHALFRIRGGTRAPAPQALCSSEHAAASAQHDARSNLTFAR